MLGLDKLIGVDAYSRNKKLLNEIGVQYTKQEHKRYLAWLVIKNAEEISLKQCLINQDAKNALTLKDSEAYYIWNLPMPSSAWEEAHAVNAQKVDHKNRAIDNVLEVYVQSLADVVEENLSVDVESIYTEQVKSETAMRKWFGQSCEQTWRLKNERNNKTALIL